jgi:hypothetical protein
MPTLIDSRKRVNNCEFLWKLHTRMHQMNEVKEHSEDVDIRYYITKDIFMLYYDQHADEFVCIFRNKLEWFNRKHFLICCFNKNFSELVYY